MHTSYMRMALERQKQARKKGYHQSHKDLTIRQRCKECGRKFVSFLFSHVGVCGLVITYTVLGALMFMNLEGPLEHVSTRRVMRIRKSHADALWNITCHLNVLDETTWRRDIGNAIREYQEKMVKEIKKGYNGATLTDRRWSFSSSLMYSLTVYTTIGYGNITPKTDAGKIATIFYALLGIPLMLLYMANVGDSLASGFRYTYFKICRSRPQNCQPRKRPATQESRKPPPDPHVPRLTLEVPGLHPELIQNLSEEHMKQEAPPLDIMGQIPVWACLTVMFSFIAAGAILFCVWEDWNFLDSSYFCFTSLVTIGFGDLVPGHAFDQRDADTLIGSVDGELIFCALYLLMGMALLAMCFHLMQEKVLKTIRMLLDRVGLLRRRCWDDSDDDEDDDGVS